jgi:hypothetical protein
MPVQIESVAYRGWPEALRLSNGVAEAIVVPAVARILHYGMVGGPNLLWDNAGVAGQSPRADQWANYGGDKLWIWPQEDWPVRTGSAWPPPTDLPNTIRNTAHTVADHALQLTSGIIPNYGLRTVREISLAAEGTRLTLSSRLEQVMGEADTPVAAWTVTQVPANGDLFARLVPGARLSEGYRLHMPDSWDAVARDGDDIVLVRRAAGHAAKLGLDADLLAWHRDGMLVVGRSVDAAAELSDFAPGDRAQIYSHLDSDPTLPPGVSYVELEFTSPLKAPLCGKSVALETHWEILSLPEHGRSHAAVAALLRTL